MLNPAKILKNQNGVIAVMTLFSVSVVALAMMGTLAILAIGEIKIANAGGVVESTFYAAEAGLNEALYRLITDPVPGTHTLEIDGINIEILVGTNPTNPYQRILTSRATGPTGKVRIVQIIANTSSFAGGFDYAVQGGSGGIYLDNNSLIIGDVYSNDNVLPASVGATGEVQGSVWAANFSTIDKVEISGNAFANTIARSDIGGNAYYQTIDGSTDVGGFPCPNSNCFPTSPNPDPKPLPLDDADINTWKDDIETAGNPVLTETPADCPPSYDTGTYCVVSSATLGGQKIEADFYLGNGAALTLNGNLWITGNIILDNNGTINIDSSLGAGSVVIIADGIVDVNNNYTITGTGDPRSFVLIVSMSTNSEVTTPAIYASNNSDSIVFAALHGMLKVKNNGALNAAAAEILFLEPNSQVTYNPLLSAFTIPSGGGETVGTALGTWQEL